MANNPLIIGPAEKLALTQLREKANAKPLVMPQVMLSLKTPMGRRLHHKRMVGLTIHIPMNYTVTFSVEVGHPSGTFRHMSMASGRHGRFPISPAVWMVCEELGFVGSLQQCIIREEDIGDGDVAINVIQPILAPGSTTPS
jgi:hypothetical protein